VHGDGLAALIVSILAGVCTLALAWRRRFERARYTAALAVAAIIVGWALAQRPLLLPGLTIKQAAAPHDTLVAVVVAVIAGAAILFPSLALLFRLLLRGALDHAQGPAPPTGPRSAVLSASAPGLLVRSSGACLIAGIGLLTAAEAAWAHAAGVVSLFSFIVLGFIAVAPARLAAVGDDDQRQHPPGTRASTPP
jgi:cytochrome d ubiquinol oxidase subunit II